ncbi:aminopeptidase [Streptomyces sp. TRM43335]|uniref:Aminopeptidase n=1 Tax=Streptomyces taklimakanensis TaxID=2569853 RepID=A0A6G2BAI1_9ACTN|nr:S28 family serine protease [Streptomyces taklimakanensis]MTE19136.1 aminopeptidase [Streptomyces taklimakanensis]
MRKALGALLTLVVLVGTVGAAGASPRATSVGGGAAKTGGADVGERIAAIPGMRLIEEKPVEGYRFFVLDYRQPVDHRKPREGTFRQRLTVLHKGEDRPTVFHTSGYGLNTAPARSEPTRMIDGNQVSLEHRFFAPSRPEPADWSKLDIRQAADDQHRVFRALHRIYGAEWISTGASKGGMTATYYRRFHPNDMDGTVAYVAPNDVNDREDSAYDEFFATVSTAECRERLNAAQREVFVRRAEIVDRYEAWAAAEGRTFEVVGSADRAFENVGLDLVWAWWQYGSGSDCDEVPPVDASTDELYDFVDRVSGFSFYTDQGLEYYTPYFHQAGTELGSPSFATPHLEGLLRHPGIYEPRTYVPRDIPMSFDSKAMRDVDRWVRGDCERMLFVYGENDPWGAEPFRPGRGSEDCHVLTAPGADHGANIAALEADDRAVATDALLRWAGEDGEAAERKAAPLAPYDARLDRAEPAERWTLRP